MQNFNQAAASGKENRAQQKTPELGGRRGFSGLEQNLVGHVNATPRRLQPPYANLARQRLHPSMAGRVPGFGSMFVHVGANAWDWKSDSRAFLVVPHGVNTENLNFSVCALATQPILVIDRGASDAELAVVARAIIRDSGQRCYVIQDNGKSSAVFRGVSHAH